MSLENKGNRHFVISDEILINISDTFMYIKDINKQLNDILTIANISINNKTFNVFKDYEISRLKEYNIECEISIDNLINTISSMLNSEEESSIERKMKISNSLYTDLNQKIEKLENKLNNLLSNNTKINIDEL
jgi:cell division protein ZapA (FtsZ GTPase activity inhibitor)